VRDTLAITPLPDAPLEGGDDAVQLFDVGAQV